MAVSKRRRLTDLFVVGTELTIGDEYGSVDVWIQKLNPVEQERALRKAQAVRSKFMASKRDQDNEVYFAAIADAMDMGRDECLDYITSDELTRNNQAIEARIAEENGWNKDDYLAGLADAWAGGDGETPLSEVYATRDDIDRWSEDQIAEAESCWAEIERFSQEVSDAVTEEREDVQRRHATKSDEELREIVAEKLHRLQADLMWSIEFKKAQLLYGVRDPIDHTKYYFSDREEIDRLNEQTLLRLLEAFTALTVDAIEGKDSRGPELSSESSEQPEIPEDSDSSQMQEALV